MCGRFEVFTYEEIEEVLDAVESRRRARVNLESNQPREQARPGSAVSLLAPAEGGSLAIARATWGFDVDWSKGPIFNTRIESALSGSAMWRTAIEDGRCIVPAAAFFETHATETAPSPRTGRPVKRPYRFVDPNGEPLLLAGVRADDRCSIVTCEPNRFVAPIHPRMPLVLRFEEVATWLSPDWPALADRSGVELAVNPEEPRAPISSDALGTPGTPDAPDQLSLF